MGPMSSFTNMLDNVRQEIEQVRSATRRLRAMNRKLTGSTGEPPTDLKAIGTPIAPEKESPPTMIALTIEISNLEVARRDLCAEIDYLSQFAETADLDAPSAKGYAGNSTR